MLLLGICQTGRQRRRVSQGHYQGCSYVYRSKRMMVRMGFESMTLRTSEWKAWGYWEVLIERPHGAKKKGRGP